MHSSSVSWVRNRLHSMAFSRRILLSHRRLLLVWGMTTRGMTARGRLVTSLVTRWVILVTLTLVGVHWVTLSMTLRVTLRCLVTLRCHVTLVTFGGLLRLRPCG